MEQNKKTLMLSLVAVLVLVGSVIGVAYAMFSFSATGTQTNVIETGYVTINYANEKTISLSNALPVADSIGATQTGEGKQLTFDVAATINGTMTVNYDLQLTGIIPGATLTEDKIKFRLEKSTDGGSSYTDVLGSDTTGVKISDRASSAGTYANATNNSTGTGVTTYAIDSGQFKQTATVKYRLTAWVDSSYQLTVGDKETTNGTGTVTQSQGTQRETFKFAVKVVAGQANPEQ